MHALRHFASYPSASCASPCLTSHEFGRDIKLPRVPLQSGCPGARLPAGAIAVWSWFRRIAALRLAVGYNKRCGDFSNWSVRRHHISFQTTPSNRAPDSLRSWGHIPCPSPDSQRSVRSSTESALLK
jgi:hypothetical protein